MNTSAKVKFEQLLSPGALGLLWVVLILMLSVELSAQVRVWDNGSGDGKWKTATNWNLDDAPDTAAETAQFGAVGPAAINQNSTGPSGNLVVGQIQFASGGIARTISGSGITVSAISGTGIINNSSSLQTFNTAMTLGASQTWNSANGAMTFAGNIASGGFVLTIDGSANTTISSILSGTGGLTKQGSGTLTLSGANTYSGLTTISAGTVLATSSAALGATSGDTTISAGATLALQGGITIATGEDLTTLNGQGVSSLGALRNLSGNNRWQANITLGSGATIYSDSGTLSIGDGGFAARTLALGANTLVVDGPGNVTVNASITGTGGVTKRGSGTLNFLSTLANTFTGTTVVEDGTLIMDNLNNANTSVRGSLFIGDGAGAAGSAVAQLGTYNAANQQILDTAAVTINSDGRLRLNGQVETFGALTFTGGSIDMDQFNPAGGAVGSLTLGGDVTANAASTTASISGNLGLGSSARTFNVADGSPAVDLDISAVVSGANGMIKTGAGLMQLGGNNTFSGNIALNAGTLRVGTDANLGNTANAVNFNGGTLNISGSFTAAATRTHQINAGGGTIEVDSSQTYTMSAANQLTGSGAFTKTGSGTLALGNSMSFNGTIAVNAGTLRLDANNVIGNNVPVSLQSGATLNLNNFNDTIGQLNFTGGSVTTGSGTLSLNGDVNVNASSSQATISGQLDLGFSTRVFTVAEGSANPDIDITASISGSGVGLTKQGSGTLKLSGSATYTGTTTINGGTLLLGSSHRILDSSQVTLGGGTLATDGNSEVVGSLTLTANSVIDLGAGSSTLLFSDSSSQSWTGGTILTIANWNGSLGGGGTDQLIFGSSATGLTPAQLGQIRFQDPFGPGSGLVNARILPSGEVVPIPEPATIFSAVLLLAAIVYRERHALASGINWNRLLQRFTTKP